MRFRTWIYFIKHASANILGNRLLHGISMGTISTSLLLFGAFILFFVNINNWIQEWGQSLSMSVYLQDGIDEKGRVRIKSRLQDLPGSQLKGFISKEQAEEDLIEALGEQAGLLNNLSGNPLPASFEVVFKDVEANELDPKRLKAELEKVGGVEEVQYSEQWIERFEGVIYILKLIGAIIGGLLCFAVLFIVTNTIKLTIYSRREEIEILKIVGATDWFVKTPFLMEGAIQGIVSGALSLIALFLIYSIVSLKAVHLFGLPVMEIVFLPQGYAILIILLSLGLGLLGSFVAIGRFFEA